MPLKRRVLWAVLAILTLSGCNLSPEAKEAKFLAKGKKEFDKRNYAVAILDFKNASEAKPWDAEPNYQLGLSHQAGGDIRLAALYLGKATELNPRHTGAQLKLAQLMVAASGDKETLEAAQKHAQAVLALLPDDPDALNVLALADLRLGKPESAQSWLERALRKSPGDVTSWALLAQVKAARNDIAGAENALRQASTNAPKSSEARRYLGEERRRRSSNSTRP
jgi:cytochrome c-type biogenesis protein CcmH/NrfG